MKKNDKNNLVICSFCNIKQEEVEFLYGKDDRDAKATLMQLSFWYAALDKHLNDPEFWTDMLFLSIKKGDRFGPFGKLY